MDKKLDQIKDYQKWLSDKNGGNVKKEARRKINGAKGWIANAVRKITRNKTWDQRVCWLRHDREEQSQSSWKVFGKAFAQQWTCIM